VRLASIKAGDMVRVDGSLAEVVDKPQAGRLTIRWVGRSTSLRTISARGVEAAWRRLASGRREEGE
jgi:hypothetical protein